MEEASEKERTLYYTVVESSLIGVLSNPFVIFQISKFLNCSEKQFEIQKQEQKKEERTAFLREKKIRTFHIL